MFTKALRSALTLPWSTRHHGHIDGDAPSLLPRFIAAITKTRGGDEIFPDSAQAESLRLNPGACSELNPFPPQAHINYLDSFTELELACFASHPFKVHSSMAPVQTAASIHTGYSVSITALVLAPHPSVPQAPGSHPSAGPMRLLPVCRTVRSASVRFCFLSLT